MKKLIQSYKTGIIELADIPIPELSDNFILVKNSYSLISAGTERKKVQTAKMNIIQKAVNRPDLVKEVVKKLKREGFKRTFKAVENRLSEPVPLGYSSSGKVIAIGGQVQGIKPGDFVSCAGAGFANHAEYCAIPNNLACKIPDGVSIKHASFATLGAIALQSIRLAEPKLGDRVLVVGLGLVGQLTAQILVANGCIVYGSDLDEVNLKTAAPYIDSVLSADDDIENYCKLNTENMGVDCVIVCASSKDPSLVNLAGNCVRPKGKVVLVGEAPLQLERGVFYEKEAELVVSRSYGPGRYDVNYELHGHDYPREYVRYTAKRNILTFLELLQKEKVNVEPLISHEFAFHNSIEAFEMISNPNMRSYMGIILKYSSKNKTEHKPLIAQNKISKAKDGVNLIDVIGAGNYVGSQILPLIKENKNFQFDHICTNTGIKNNSLIKKFGFLSGSAVAEQIMKNSNTLVLVGTRHDTHAPLVSDAILKKKHVFVEKPLGISIEQLKLIYSQSIKCKCDSVFVGFNRSFSPFVKKIQELLSFKTGPSVLNIAVNAGELPDDHWVHDVEFGGGRFIGEACHFVDLSSTIIGKRIKTVFAVSMDEKNKVAQANENFSFILSYEDGSIATITYFVNGDSAMPKEFIHVSKNGVSCRIEDFKSLEIFEQGKLTVKNTTMDKGQQNMISEWFKCYQNGRYPHFNQQLESSVATLLAVESSLSGQPIEIEDTYKVFYDG